MKKTYLVLALLLTVISSCKKTPDVNTVYVDVQNETLTVGTSDADFKCEYNYIKTLDKAYLYYGLSNNNMNQVEMKVADYLLNVRISNLQPATTYTYHYEFDNGYNRMVTMAKTFTTDITHPTRPEISTLEAGNITETTATCGGLIISNGGAEIIERGVCWSQNPKPTLEDEHAIAELGGDEFHIVVENLDKNTSYHVRAFAKNEVGISYGQDVEFTTDGPDIPVGTINGLFSIGENRQVYFSIGNLQYQASSNTWRFAENQWDYVGGNNDGTVYHNGEKCNNCNISPTYNGWIDLFCWGTSGYEHGAVCYQPWSISNNDYDYCAYGNPDYDLNSENGQADWGYNKISNGGGLENTWHTLSIQEWEYLFESRITASGIVFAMARVNDIVGIILLPDSWNPDFYLLEHTNEFDVSYEYNNISIDDWNNILEYNGAVFLPAAGRRDGTEVVEDGIHDSGKSGEYWSTTNGGSSCSYAFYFRNDHHVTTNWDYHFFGCSVRLVKDYLSEK